MDMSQSSSKNDYKMHMTLYGGHKALILFDQWKTTTWAYYFLSLLGLFLFSLFYQWLQSRMNRYRRGCGSTGSHLLWRFLWSCEYTVTVGTAYMLMLAVMTFNGGIFVVIVLGFGFGHFIFNTTAASADDASAKPAPICCV